MGSPVACATARKCVRVSRWSDLYTMAGSTISPSRPMRSASRAKRQASDVVYSATPASTGMRPRSRALHFLQHGQFLFIFEGGVFAHRAQQDHAVNAGADHGFQMFGGGRQIERLIARELRGDGGKYAFPVDFHTFTVD